MARFLRILRILNILELKLTLPAGYLLFLILQLEDTLDSHVAGEILVSRKKVLPRYLTKQRNQGRTIREQLETLCTVRNIEIHLFRQQLPKKLRKTFLQRRSITKNSY